MRFTAILLLCSTIAAAKPMAPIDVPIERLRKNIEARIARDPADPHGHYVLGRLHAFALHQGSETTVALHAGQPDHGRDRLPEGARLDTSKLTLQRIARLKAAIAAFRRAIGASEGRNPGAGLMAQLGLAWVLEYGAPAAARIGLPPGAAAAPLPSAGERKQYEQWLAELEQPARRAAAARLTGAIERAWPVVFAARNAKDAALRGQIEQLLAAEWTRRALARYRIAYAGARAVDLKSPTYSWVAQLPVTMDAGNSILRLLRARTPTAAEQREAAEIRATLARFREQRIISPIVFSLARAQHGLHDLLDPRATVRFDLAGSGHRDRWPWVRADTCLLVWDPRRTGQVRSGRQLFGNVTWWIFWSDGYQPLAALDDDGDGWLAGPELRGLAAWRDRNQNGISEPGEVLPLERIGVRRLAAHADRIAGGVPAHGRGVELADGRRVPSYDWTPVSRGR